MVRWVGLAGAAAVVGGAHAACPATPPEVVTAARGASVAFASMEATAFDAAITETRTLLGCVAAPLSPRQAGEVHVAMALKAYFDGDTMGATDAFAALRATDPAFTLSDDVAPPGSPLRDIFEDVPMGGYLEMVPASAAAPGHTLRVDGRDRTERPSARPVVLQDINDIGRAVHSTWLDAGEAPPPWVQGQVVPQPTSTANYGAGGRAGSSPARRTLLWTAGGTALVAGGLWATSARMRTTHEDLRERVRTGAEPGFTTADAEVAARRVNRMGYAAQATTAVAGAMVGVAFLF